LRKNTINPDSGKIKMMQKQAAAIFVELKTCQLKTGKTMDVLKELQRKINLLKAPIAEKKYTTDQLIVELTNVLQKLDEIAEAAANNVEL